MSWQVEVEPNSNHAFPTRHIRDQPIGVVVIRYDLSESPFGAACANFGKLALLSPLDRSEKWKLVEYEGLKGGGFSTTTVLTGVEEIAVNGESIFARTDLGLFEVWKKDPDFTPRPVSAPPGELKFVAPGNLKSK